MQLTTCNIRFAVILHVTFLCYTTYVTLFLSLLSSVTQQRESCIVMQRNIKRAAERRSFPHPPQRPHSSSTPSQLQQRRHDCLVCILPSGSPVVPFVHQLDIHFDPQRTYSDILAVVGVHRHNTKLTPHEGKIKNPRPSFYSYSTPERLEYTAFRHLVIRSWLTVQLRCIQSIDVVRSLVYHKTALSPLPHPSCKRLLRFIIRSAAKTKVLGEKTSIRTDSIRSGISIIILVIGQLSFLFHVAG